MEHSVSNCENFSFKMVVFFSHWPGTTYTQLFVKYYSKICFHYDYVPRGASNLEELHQLLKRNVMIRRLKCDVSGSFTLPALAVAYRISNKGQTQFQVLTELPAKQRQKITFDLAESDSKKVYLDMTYFPLNIKVQA